MCPGFCHNGRAAGKISHEVCHALSSSLGKGILANRQASQVLDSQNASRVMKPRQGSCENAPSILDVKPTGLGSQNYFVPQSFCLSKPFYASVWLPFVVFGYPGSEGTSPNPRKSRKKALFQRSRS